MFDEIIDNYTNNQKSKNVESDIIICHNVGHRFVKSLVVDSQNYESQSDHPYQELIENLYQLIEKELPVILPTKGIFIVVAFIEFTRYKDQVI